VRGQARPGLAGRGRAVRGKASFYKGIFGTARHGKAWRGAAGQGLAGLGAARQGFFFGDPSMVAKSKAVVAEAGTKDMIRRLVRLQGITAVMFDRYAGDNDTKLEPMQKLYLDEERNICLPAANIHSFLSAKNTVSAPRRLRGKKGLSIANSCLSFTIIEPMMIPFLKDNQPIKFGKFDGDKDALSGCYIDRRVARLKDGVPNPKVRPVLPLPWELEFQLTILPNTEIQEVQIRNLIQEGGYAIGIGTYRGVFGKFKILKWEPID